MDVLDNFIKNGHLHKGAKPVHWCTDCGSALAEAEVEYQDKQSPAIDVRFEFADQDAVINAFELADGHKGTGTVSTAIWTTTPWTLPSNLALCVHPELDYVKVKVRSDNFQNQILT